MFTCLNHYIVYLLYRIDKIRIRFLGFSKLGIFLMDDYSMIIYLFICYILELIVKKQDLGESFDLGFRIGAFSICLFLKIRKVWKLAS